MGPRRGHGVRAAARAPRSAGARCRSTRGSSRRSTRFLAPPRRRGRGAAAADALDDAARRARRGRRDAIRRSRATTASRSPRSPRALGGELQPFQWAGVRYALDARRAFLADEQGLGKTVEALAALEADGAYPAVVVCPASLKLNWEREAAQAGCRTARSPSSRAARAVPADAATSRSSTTRSSPRTASELARCAPRALVVDESHYCKNPQRQAHPGGAPARRRRSPTDGLRLALTGTPVLNHAEELIAQLRVIGRLEDFGSGARFAAPVPGPRSPRSACTGTCAGAASCGG